MSKKPVQPKTVAVEESGDKSVVVEPLGSKPVTPRLSDVDKLELDLARSKRQTALAEAKTALAQNENAELNYKYVVLQLYMKYHLTDRDAISENGEILIDGAVNMQSQGQ